MGANLRCIITSNGHILHTFGILADSGVFEGNFMTLVPISRVVYRVLSASLSLETMQYYYLYGYIPSANVIQDEMLQNSDRDF